MVREAARGNGPVEKTGTALRADFTPLLHTRLARLPWVDVPTVEVTRDHGHGRDETRTLKVATVGFLDFPHAAQAVRIIRWRRGGRPPTQPRNRLPDH
ncbi:hypothetical protein [Candidatus Protofrankia californiensis]|uniref:hypothetical protein n=1 Tax=Candidatus Protofrankia californiensis TaxID=1839754 RepID=UPI0013EA2538|nr:hypothetical protein [Candidatus Protofrankia californiensis]